MYGELTLKLLLEADIVLGSESANGTCSMWFAVRECEAFEIPLLKGIGSNFSGAQSICAAGEQGVNSNFTPKRTNLG